MIATWKQQARRELIELRGAFVRVELSTDARPERRADGRWRAWALLASGDEATSAADIATSHEAAAWLAAIQRSDGSLPVYATGFRRRAGRLPYALLLWSALAGYQERRQSRAATWLLRRQG